MRNIKTIFFFTLLYFAILKSVSQNYADPKYYLVDSLDLDAVGENDKKIVDASLKLFHEAINDTSRINAVNVIVEESWDDDVWPKYNMWIYNFVTKKNGILSSNRRNLTS